jgi:hypothetical protein
MLSPSLVDKTAVSFLRHFEDWFIHGATFPIAAASEQVLPQARSVIPAELGETAR